MPECGPQMGVIFVLFAAVIPCLLVWLAYRCGMPKARLWQVGSPAGAIGFIVAVVANANLFPFGACQ